MKGSIRERTKGRWEISIDIGRDPITGKRQRRFETVSGSKKVAQQQLNELLVDYDRGIGMKPSHLTLGEYLGQWLEGYVKTSCSARTLEGYKSIIDRHLIPSLGHFLLNKLQPQQIQKCYATLLEHGRVVGGGPLSARTVLHIHRVLFQGLEHALRQGLIFRNPAQLVDPPRARRAKMKPLNPSEVAVLLRSVEGTEYYAIIYAAVNTGLRQGELLGLRWADVDLELATISVTQSLYKSGGIFTFLEPKSERSRRRVDMTPSLAIFLRNYRREREIELLELGKILSNSDMVFGNTVGGPMNPGTISHKFAKIAKKAGLTGTRFHDLRHTYASLMLMAGVHPKIVSEALGHASVAFTLDTYSHVLGGLQEEAAKKLDEVLGKWINPENVGIMSARE